MDARILQYMDAWMHACMDGRTDGMTDRWMHGCRDVCMYVCNIMYCNVMYVRMYE